MSAACGLFIPLPVDTCHRGPLSAALSGQRPRAHGPPLTLERRAVTRGRERPFDIFIRASEAGLMHMTFVLSNSTPPAILPLAAHADPDGKPDIGTEVSARLAQVATQLLRLRRSRHDIFGPVFSEPGWNILLDLFVCESNGTACSVSDICIGSAAPSTTALRWLSKLDQMKLIVRQNDLADRRRRLVTLSASGRSKMVEHLTWVEQAMAHLNSCGLTEAPAPPGKSATAKPD
jgi:DNA-binding MarR family transcriptional regulator